MDYRQIIKEIESQFNPPWNIFSGGFSGRETSINTNINDHNYDIELIRKGLVVKVKTITCTDIKYIRKEKLEKIKKSNGE